MEKTIILLKTPEGRKEWNGAEIFKDEARYRDQVKS